MLFPVGSVGAGLASPVSSVSPGSAAASAYTRPENGESFGEVMAQFAADTVKAVRVGEAASVAGIKGEVPLQNVVESLMQAERSLQTALAIRDKAVAAYQEISRMTI